MRKRVEHGGVTIQAIAGNHAIFLGLDLAPAALAGCLGFAVHRTDHTEHEQYWLSGFKTFRSVVPVPNPETFYSTRDHPLQTFYWGDYSAKPGHRYTYRVVPRYGTPKNLRGRRGVRASVEISTNDPAQGAHGVYFNRGVAASQAYQQKFGQPPDKLDPEKRRAALTWLSRGLMEAILAFIGQAAAGDALRAAVYEFTQPDVLAAFKAAHERGADVRIVYHALDDDEGERNRKAIDAAGLDQAILIPRTKANLAHNKFIVFCRNAAAGDPTAESVWTGSTNLSEGGIYGHSNVGHEVRDPEVASRYLGFWSKLAQDPQIVDLRDWTTANSPFDAAALGAPAIHTLFSPRHGDAPLTWYTQQFVGPGASAYITEAFGMNKLFETALDGYSGDGLHYVLLDKVDDHQAQWSGHKRRVFVAVGTTGGPAALTRWAQEHLTNFNPRVPYLHTKVLLADPLGTEPLVISGSANFSPNSTSSNDENMLVVPGDTELADVYFTEFSRIFNHFYARWWASQLETGGADAHSFLDETDAWHKPYFVPGNPKYFQRTLFSSGVKGNPP
jgi:phosphatidylserine/phosphatidylglycerophosphate/cardiolipin synthase-like enzyme